MKTSLLTGSRAAAASPSRRIRKAAVVVGAACLLGAAGAAAGDHDYDHGPGGGSFSLSGQGVLYEGGVYDNPSAPTTMSGQMHVFYQIPEGYRWGGRGSHPPIIMIHGSQQTGANFLGTPDGRPGWAQFFVAHGWPVFVIDQPGRGKSGYFPNAYGPQAANPSPTTVQHMFTAPELTVPLQWPEAKLHTQWPGGPGSGVPGEYAFDQFFASQVANMPSNDQALDLTTKAVTDLHRQDRPLGHRHPFDVGTDELEDPAGEPRQDQGGPRRRAVRQLEPHAKRRAAGALWADRRRMPEFFPAGQRPRGYASCVRAAAEFQFRGMLAAGPHQDNSQADGFERHSDHDRDGRGLVSLDL